MYSPHTNPKRSVSQSAMMCQTQIYLHDHQTLGNLVSQNLYGQSSSDGARLRPFQQLLGGVTDKVIVSGAAEAVVTM